MTMHAGRAAAIRRVLATGLAGAVLAGVAAAQQIEPRVVFDDFADPRSGWTEHAANGGIEIAYRDGTYQVVMTTPTPLQVIGSGTRLADGAVSVDVANLEPSVPHPQGLFVRGQDSDNYYGFLVQSDGTFTVFRWENGMYYSESAANMQLPAGLYSTDGMNALDVMTEGQRIRFFVNFVEVFEVRNTKWIDGEAGLLFGNLSFDRAGTVYDNWRIQILR
ncbi:MAG: hypothetical protein IT534_03855 [Bauldia sp.]|jgi:hypothetical protein|nr:hypothetical protein [Bauldia sp.]